MKIECNEPSEQTRGQSRGHVHRVSKIARSTCILAAFRRGESKAFNKSLMPISAGIERAF